MWPTGRHALYAGMIASGGVHDSGISAAPMLKMANSGAGWLL